ncbi:TetR/AcrR family transcriptional regulator [Gluconobacter wancherniae]|uniref:TetR/AcrR family transcriptional regulator n=1 Tax=Gluconobacter wancherniae TaxID=1307955 RepID=UPI001B8CE5DF|nr:TetR/AcrR family transcriptional regulator [Gluconobacter wancherniae]MBS1088662.1 TetR/AcrR family transcriptional regulator [Gluconobacter wancherniae]
MSSIEDDRLSGTARDEDSASACAIRAKRNQILAGAGTVFLVSGYEGASMSQIAREAGVSKGTLYNHFDGKASLFSAFFEEQSRTKLDMLFAAVNDDGLDFRTGLIQLATAVVKVLLSPASMSLYRIIVAEASQFPNLADTFWRYGFARTLDSLSTWLARKAAEGVVVIDDPALTAEQFMMMCQTRIVQRRRLMLPVEDDAASIQKLAVFTADSFLKIYGTEHQ